MVDHSDIDESFHRLTRMAARVFKAPIAAICTVNMEKLWFANRAGGTLTSPEPQATNVYDMFCHYQISHAAEDPLLVVLNTTEDSRFQNFPLAVNIEETSISPIEQHADNATTTGAGTALIHFYVGRVIKIRDMIIGTFCIMDIVPHQTFTTREQNLFEEFTMMLNELLISNEEYVSHLYQYEQEMLRERETANVVVNILSNLKYPLQKVTKASKQLNRLVCPESRRKSSHFYTAFNTSRTSKRASSSLSTHRMMSRSSYGANSNSIRVGEIDLTAIATTPLAASSTVVKATTSDMIVHDMEGNEGIIKEHEHEEIDHNHDQYEHEHGHDEEEHHHTEVETHQKVHHEEEQNGIDDVVPFDFIHPIPTPTKRSTSSSASANHHHQLSLRTLSHQNSNSVHSMSEHNISSPLSSSLHHHSSSISFPTIPHVLIPSLSHHFHQQHQQQHHHTIINPTITIAMIKQAMTNLQQALSFLQSMIEHTVYMNTLVLSTTSTSSSTSNNNNNNNNASNTAGILWGQVHHPTTNSGIVSRPIRGRQSVSSMSMMIAHSISLFNLDQYLAWCIHEFRSSFQLDCQLIYHDTNHLYTLLHDSSDRNNNNHNHNNIGINVSLLWMILFFILSRESKNYTTCIIDCKILPNEIIIPNNTTATSSYSSAKESILLDNSSSGRNNENSIQSKLSSTNPPYSSHYEPLLSWEITFSGKKTNSHHNNGGISGRTNPTNMSSSSSSSHLTSNNDYFEEIDDDLFNNEDDLFSNDSTSSKFDYHSEEMIYFQRFLSMFSIDHSILFTTKPTLPPPIITTTTAFSPLSGNSNYPSKVSSPLASMLIKPSLLHHQSIPGSPTSVTSKQSHHSTTNSHTSSTAGGAAGGVASATSTAVQLLQKLLKSHSNMLLSPRINSPPKQYQSPKLSPMQSPKHSFTHTSHHNSNHNSNHNSSHNSHHNSNHSSNNNSNHITDNHKDGELHTSGISDVTTTTTTILEKQQLVTWKLLIPTHTTINNNPNTHNNTHNNTTNTTSTEQQEKDKHHKHHHNHSHHHSHSHGKKQRRASVVQQHTITISTQQPVNSSRIVPICDSIDQYDDTNTSNRILASNSNETIEGITHSMDDSMESSMNIGYNPLSTSSGPSPLPPQHSSTNNTQHKPPPRLQSKKSFRSFNQSFSMVRTYSRLPINFTSLPHAASSVLLLASQKSNATNHTTTSNPPIQHSHGTSSSSGTLSSPHLHIHTSSSLHHTSLGKSLHDLEEEEGGNNGDYDDKMIGLLPDHLLHQSHQSRMSHISLENGQTNTNITGSVPKQGVFTSFFTRRSRLLNNSNNSSNAQIKTNDNEDIHKRSLSLFLSDDERRKHTTTTTTTNHNESEVTHVVRLEIKPNSSQPTTTTNHNTIDNSEKEKSKHRGRLWYFFQCISITSCISTSPHPSTLPIDPLLVLQQDEKEKEKEKEKEEKELKKKQQQLQQLLAEKDEELEAAILEQSITEKPHHDHESYENKKRLKPVFQHHHRRSKPYQLDNHPNNPTNPTNNHTNNPIEQSLLHQHHLHRPKPTPYSPSASSRSLLRWVSGWLRLNEGGISSIRSHTSSFHGQLGSSSNSTNASMLIRFQANLHNNNNPNNPTNNPTTATAITATNDTNPTGGVYTKKIHPVAWPVTSSNNNLSSRYVPSAAVTTTIVTQEVTVS